MNAILSFCHFCELHGPRVVFNTQAFREAPSFDRILYGENPQSSSSCTKQEESSFWKYGRLERSEANKNQKANIETCAACQSFQHHEAGFVSNDDTSKISYVSSQYPLQDDLCAVVRQACIRSLSCEDCSGREGPIYFGDEQRGHVISYTFFLRDQQARGFQRWYSILVLMKDRLFLLNSWSFLLKHIKEIIDSMQDSSSKIFSDEKARDSTSKEAFLAESSRKPRGGGSPRSLKEVVGNQNIWGQLHLVFTWILKAGGLRLKEHMIVGHPLTLTCEGPVEGGALRQLYRRLGTCCFQKIVHHMYTGSQVIIQSDKSEVYMSVIKVLKFLLPKFLSGSVDSAEKCLSHHDCNLLGIPPSVPVPAALSQAVVVCIASDVTASSEESFSEHVMTSSSSSNKETLSSSSWHGMNVKIMECGVLPVKAPQLVTRLIDTFANPAVSDSLLCTYISVLLDIWTNKVKVWQHLVTSRTKLAPPQQPSYLKLNRSFSSSTLSQEHSPPPGSSNITSLSPGAFSPPKSPSQFAPFTPSSQCALLLSVGALECDIPLLEAWSAKYIRS